MGRSLIRDSLPCSWSLAARASPSYCQVFAKEVQLTSLKPVPQGVADGEGGAAHEARLVVGCQKQREVNFFEVLTPLVNTGVRTPLTTYDEKQKRGPKKVKR